MNAIDKLKELRQVAGRTMTEIGTYLGEVEAAAIEGDLKTVDSSFRDALQWQDKLRKIIDTDIAGLVDEIAPYGGEKVEDACNAASDDVMHVHSMLWTIKNSLAHRNANGDRPQGDAHEAFIGELIEECTEIDTLLRKERLEDAIGALEKLRLRLRILGMSIDGQCRTDERDVADIALYFAERAEEEIRGVTS